MKKRSVGLAIVLLIAVTTAGRALDTVKMTKGAQGGRVVGMSPLKVDIEQGSSGDIAKEIPVNQVVTILFEDDPSELKTAKGHVVAGRFTEAQQALERIKDDVSRLEIQQDIEFYKALCAARLALGGTGKIADAGRLMKAFADAHKGSYHYFEAAETAGDLLVAVRQYGLAAEYYARLEKAPWADYKMRAGVAAGRAFLAQGKTDEALKSFDKVLATVASGELADTQRAMANLGKAGVLAATKKSDDAIKIVNAILQKADPEDVQLMARAYNVLGTAQRQAGRTKEALLAFLHVEVLYSGVPEAHAEALANLADLWGQAHKSERAQRARNTLKEQYPDSPWTKKGG